MDGIRKAEVSLPRSAVGGDLIQAAIDKWNLSPDAILTLENTSLNRPVHEGDALSPDLVRDGDVLQLRLVLQGA
jgi:hypothetical protein